MTIQWYKRFGSGSMAKENIRVRQGMHSNRMLTVGLTGAPIYTYCAAEIVKQHQIFGFNHTNIVVQIMEHVLFPLQAHAMEKHTPLHRMFRKVRVTLTL